MLLLDNSAWARRLKAPIRDRFSAVFDARLFVACVPFLLEVGYSARSSREHRQGLRRLALLPFVKITPEVEQLALDAQSDLARVGHHRLRPIDVLIPAPTRPTAASCTMTATTTS